MGKHVQIMADHRSKLLVCVFLVLTTQTFSELTDKINITYVNSAVEKGAVCLDGTPPAYYHSVGFGDGADNWLVYLEGGAWCNSTETCLERVQIKWLASTSTRPAIRYVSGIFTVNQTFNQAFYNWNKVIVVYCDGASFTGDVEEVDPTTNLHYRGARIFRAVIDDLLAKGMKNAKNAVLTGSSAGGLATILNCDRFRSLVSHATRVKCISDSGFFIHSKNMPGAYEREAYFTQVAELHGMAKALPQSCASKMNPGLCLFPEYVIKDMQTPLFILDSLFDLYQIKEMLAPFVGGYKEQWDDCTTNLTLCTSSQLQIMKDHRTAVLETLQEVESPSLGIFVHTCFLHTHVLDKDGWRCSFVARNVLANKTIEEAIDDWYYDRSSFQQIDTYTTVPRNCTVSRDNDIMNQRCLHPKHVHPMY
ncbi:hypothetical protein ACP275_01G049200 [Erythranthe tilingii]